MDRKEAWTIVKEESEKLVEAVKSNPHDRGFKGRLEQLGRMASLTTLVLLEASMVGDKANDVARAAAMAARKAKKEGKAADLYKNVPNKLIEVAGLLDEAGVPIVGSVPELYGIGATMVEMNLDAVKAARYNLNQIFGAVKNVKDRLTIRFPSGWDSVTA